MAINPKLSYEWYIPERVYIIHIGGVLTVEMLAEMSQHNINMLNESGRTKTVHLIYNAEAIYLEPDMMMADIHDWAALVYAHPLIASIVTVIGRNRLNAYIANSINGIFSSGSPWGKIAETLNEGLRMVSALDSSLPHMNI